MSNKVADLRQRHETALERMEDIALQLEGIDDSVDPDVVKEVEARFKEAEDEADKIGRDLERAERVMKARDRTLNADPAPDEEDEQPEERRREPTRPKGNSAAGDRVYRPDNSNGNFFLADVVDARKGNQGAVERLKRNSREILVETRDLSSTATAGGDFIAPTYLMDEWTEVIRMGRPFATAVNNRPLPDRTGSVSWPKVSTGSAVAAQSDLGAVQETDPVTALVTVNVKTLAGQVDTSRQLLDRSTPGIDEVLFADLRADYNVRIDLQALTGSGSGANAKGVTSDSNRIQVTYTDASPTVGEFYSKIQDAAQQILANRGMPADTIVMHPRRWAWIAAAVDSTGRPLINPSGDGMNSPGSAAGIVDLGRPGFQIAGLSVVVDANLPTNLGAGTNEDIAIVMRAADVVLWERGNPSTLTFEEILSANLAIRFQLYNYFAFTTERYSKAVATIGGTGLVAPTF